MSSDAPRTIVVPPTSTVKFLAVSTVVILRTGGRAAMPGPGGEPPFSRVALRATARVRSVRCRMRWDPIAAVATDDPYSLYRELRDAAPVYHDPERDLWYLSRYADVHDAVNNAARFSSAQGVVPSGFVSDTPVLITMDPPEHTELRKAVQRAFTPKQIAEMEA